MNAPHSLEHTVAVLEGFELSPQQAQLWQWQQQSFVSPPVAELQLRLEAPVDAARLRRSLEQIIERHEILRTHFRQLAGMALPMQVIAPAPDYRWNLAEDVSNNTKADNLHVAVSTLADGSVHVRLRLPAIHADAASLQQLAAEWQRDYADAEMGKMGDLLLQYADYAAWRNQLLAETSAVPPIWESSCSIKTAAFTLPLQRHPVADGRAHPAEAACVLPPELLQHWQAYASSLGIDNALVALATWLTLCHQHSEADRLTVGFDWQQRSEPLTGAIGLFGEPLPLTVEDLDTLTFDELCRRLAQQCAQLDEWRDTYPGAASPEPFALGFRHVPWCGLDELEAAGWHVERLFSPTAPFQLLLEHRAIAGNTSLTWHYNAALYDSTAIDLLTDQFATLLGNACRHPERHLRDLSACSENELRLLADELSRALPLTPAQQRQYDAIASLPNLAACLTGHFREQIEQDAARQAVVGPSGALTYAELDAQSTALALQLLERGIRPETRIVHFLPRDIDAIVAMLAIFKAGASYVPVDPAYPESRIEYILNDSQAELIVTRSDLIARLPTAWQDRAMAIDCMVETMSTSSAQAFSGPASEPGHCAYIIYTSGSTGQPKGVVITHANALHSLAARIAYYPEPVRRFLLLSSFAFDSSIAGLFWTLAQGGCLHLCSESQQKDPAQLAGIVREASITHLLALPSLHALLLDELGATDELPDLALNTVIVAGEACPRALVDAHCHRLSAARLYNEYGPTEASVWSSVAVCNTNDGDGPVTIGRAIPHARIHVLNEHGEPVARGLKGEVHIGGPGLSPGYLGRPELTAEKFIAAAHPRLSPQRLYRTGDHAYLDQHGDLVFLGRADNQIKIRGHRIELGEIEAALCTVTGAKQAVALADRDPQGHPILRAFIESAQPVDAAILRQQLARRLPDYMVPSDIQALPALPRTANGKFDAKALLALKPSQQRPPFVAPRTHAERVLAGLWQELLAVDAIGIHDDFFALGGHSLLVVRLTHRIKAILGIDVPVGTVFQHRTVEHLAAQFASSSEQASLVSLRSGEPSQLPLFCLHRPAGDVHHYVPLVEALPVGQPIYGLQLPDGSSPHNAGLRDLAEIYLADIRSAQPHGPYLLCGWSMGGLLALEIAHRLEQANERVALLALFDTTFHAEDESLEFTQLREVIEQELTDAGRERLAAMPEALELLREVTAGLVKVEQLRYALTEWAVQHGLPLQAPAELIEAHLLAMRNARRWVQEYTPPRVQTDLHMWWAEATLAARPGLPAEWEQFAGGSMHSYRIPGDHDDILRQPQSHDTFRAALAAAAHSQEQRA